MQATIIGSAGTRHEGQSQQVYSNETDPKRRELLADVTEKIQVELSKRYSALAIEIERENDIASILNNGGKDIDAAMHELRSTSTQIQNAIAYVDEV